MPTFYRRFYLKQLEKSYQEEKEAYDKASGKSSKGISRPPSVKK
jgi:hypothetical protein